MYILCDTCSVIMLLRIAPNMFIDERFACVTTVEVRHEFVTNKRFKSKYPWRNDLMGRIKTLSSLEIENGDYDRALEIVRSIYVNLSNMRNNLSLIDKKLAACAMAHKYKMTTTDRNLENFLKEHIFDSEKDVLSPLHVLNSWIEDGLIKWSEELEKILVDWKNQGERSQPKSAIKVFEQLTGSKYCGP